MCLPITKPFNKPLFKPCQPFFPALMSTKNVRIKGHYLSTIFPALTSTKNVRIKGYFL